MDENVNKQVKELLVEGNLGVNEELLLAEKIKTVTPILESISDLLEGGRISLKNQQFRMQANHDVIVSQEKQISDNRALIEDAKRQAQSIINLAEERKADVEKSITGLIAETKHLNREAKKMKEEAEKMLWEASNKVRTKA